MLLDLSPILLSTGSKSRLRPLFNGTALGRCTPEDEDEDQDNVEDDSGDKGIELPTSSSFYPPHKGSLLLALPAHLSPTSGALWSKAGLHVHAEAVLAVLDDLRRGDDLLVVVEDDRFSLTSNFHDLHLAWIELLHLLVVIITIIMGCTQIPISTLSHIYGFLCVYMG